MTVGGTSRTIVIGGTRYRQDRPGAAWQVDRDGPPLRVPSFIWDYFRPFRDARIVGSQRIGQLDTRIVAFYGQTGDTHLWFKVWVAPSGLVPKAEMRAQGHFMDERYSAFDAPFAIEPPVPGGS